MVRHPHLQEIPMVPQMLLRLVLEILMDPLLLLPSVQVILMDHLLLQSAPLLQLQFSLNMDHHQMIVKSSGA